VGVFLTRLTLLMPTFSLPSTPPRLTTRLRCGGNAPLPPDKIGPIASVVDLSPATFSAQNHSTSELLRTLLMVAASKPTSWLSEQFYILYHLAYTSGP
jgi:hypothetical protein